MPSGALTTAVAAAYALLGTLIITPLANVIWHRGPKGAGLGFTAAVSSYECSLVFTMLRSRRS